MSDPLGRVQLWKPSGISSRSRTRTRPQARPGTPVRVPAWYPGVEDALAALQGVSSTAVADAAFWGFRTASDFAGQVEELSRTMEYLQLVAAAAVDRARRAGHGRGRPAAPASRGLDHRLAGATSGSASGAPPDSRTAALGPRTTTRPAGAAEAQVPRARRIGRRPCRDARCLRCHRPGRRVRGAAGDADAVDDGYRNTAEFLRARLRISAAEARRRLALGRGRAAPDPARRPAAACRAARRNSAPRSPPRRSRPGPRASSPSRWTGSGTSATPRPRPGWNTP